MCPPTNASNDVSYVWMASDKDVIWNPRLLPCGTRSLTMEQLFSHRNKIRIFPACLYFSLPKGHFLRSQRNSADYISSTAAFQGVGGSHTWAGRRRWSTELGGQISGICPPHPPAAQKLKSSGLFPVAWWRFQKPTPSAWPSPDMGWTLSKCLPWPTPSP